MVPLAYAFSRFVCWLVFTIGFGLEVRGQEHVPKRGGVILACNHVSFIDPPVLGAAAPRRITFMARADLFRQWLLGAYMRSVGVIPLRRGEADLSAIREAADALRRGHMVAIFPEGGRQRSGQLGAAKRGVGLLAQLAQVPVVPVLIQGTFDALPRGASSLRRAKIRVAFDAPISYTVASPLPTTSHPERRHPGEEGGQPPARIAHERLAEAVTAAWHRLKGSAS